MKQLLKLYVPEFLKNALYLFLLSWPISFIIFQITNKSDDYIKIHYGFFIIFYFILFLFSYPLTKGLKWILYTPIHKKEIIIFNIIFQLYKILLVFILFYLTSLILNKISPLEVAISTLSAAPDKHTQLLIHTMFEFLQTSHFLFSCILFLTFISCSIFSISPQLLIENRYVIGPKWKDYLFYLKKNPFLIFLIFIFFIIAKMTYDYWTSPILIMSLAFSYLIFAFLYSYSSRLLYPKKIYIFQGIFALIGGMIFFTISYSYSIGRFEQKNLKASLKVKEIFFLKKFSPYPTQETILSYLEEDLDKYDLSEMISFLTKTKITAQSQAMFPLQNLNLPPLSFSKIMNSKKSSSGLMASLRLFSLNKITTDQWITFLKQWATVAKKENFIFHKELRNMMMNISLSEQQLKKIFYKSDLYSQIFVLEYIKQKKNISLLPYLIAHSQDMEDEVIFMTTKTISHLLCKKISSKDLWSISFSKKNINKSFFQSECKRDQSMDQSKNEQISSNHPYFSNILDVPI